MLFKAQKIFQEIIERLPSRTSSIIEKRFGIRGRVFTLQSIGDKYGITRERVRQIEKAALMSIRKNFYKELSPFLDYLKTYIDKHGSLMEENSIVESLLSEFHISSNVEFFRGHILLGLKLGEERLKKFCSSEEFWSHWVTNEETADKVKLTLRDLVPFLKRTGHPLTLGEVRNFFARRGIKTNNLHITSYIAVSKDIYSNYFHYFGLLDWPEIKPRGIKDKSFLVMKNLGKPLHFRELTEAINKYIPSAKKVLPQTVHNELIKDARFVLIGRGIYALREWGYQPGTVKDVITRLLRKNGPMSQSRILRAVLKERLVKPSTVILNLHNNREFIRDSKGNFRLLKSGLKYKGVSS